MNPLTRARAVTVCDHLETPSAITLKSASAIAEIRTMDMRAGTETALVRVVTVFGAARPHHAYVLANRRTTRIKVLVHDGFGL